MLYIPVKSPHADVTWTKGAKRLMANLGRFAEMLNSFDEQEVSSNDLLENLSVYVEDNTVDLNYHKSLGHPDAVLQICQWVINVMRYVYKYPLAELSVWRQVWRQNTELSSTILLCSYHQMLENKVKPLQTKLKSMKQLHADLKHKLLALTDKIHVSFGL